MLKKIKQYFLILVTLSLLITNSVSAKMTEDLLYIYGQNNILYYEPDGCIESSSSVSCVPPTGNQITWIGDSYSTGAQSIIKEQLPGISFGSSIDDPNSTIQACKFVNTDTTCNAKPTNPSGLNILRDLISKGELKPYLVFALGTNGGWTSDAISEFKQIMSSETDTKVVLVTSMTPNNDYSDSNNLLSNLADSNPNYYLADWTEVYDSKYFEGDPEKIHPVSNGGYKKWVETIVNTLPQSCTNGNALLPGASVAEKIWNWLVNYINSQNLSKNTSAIVAGIMGNFYVESGLNPFMVGSEGGFYGLYMLFWEYGGKDYKNETVEAVGGDYFKFYGWWKDENEVDQDLKEEGLSEEQIDQAIDINLQVLTHSGTWPEFITGVKTWGVADTARGYSDLFLVTIERAINGESPIEDPAVASHYGGLYQGSSARRYQADYFYDKYANSTAINPTIGTTASNTNTKVGNNENYNGEKVWEDYQLEQIEKNKDVYMSAAEQYGVPWQAIATVHRLEYSLQVANPSNGQGIYQLYTYTDGGKNSNAFYPEGPVSREEFQRQTNIATSIMKSKIESAGYSVNSDEGIKYLFFSYNGIAGQYKQKALNMGFTQEEANIGEGSPYVMNRYDAKRDPNSPEMDPHWPGRFTDDGIWDDNATQYDFGAFVLYTALGGGTGSSSGSKACNDNKLVANGDLIKFVLEYAWPEYHDPVYLDAMPAYEEAYNRRVEEGKYVGSRATMADCGGFVTTLIQESGFDPNYNKYVGATYDQEKYLVSTSDWELVNDSYNQPISDESKLSPGDVAFSGCGDEPGSCGHTYIYVGEVSGFDTHIASASWDERTPMAGHEAIVGNNINWYHKVK